LLEAEFEKQKLDVDAECNIKGDLKEGEM
jgi:hypothetical protein